jgi:NADPH:quinone reductase-like Zn-dependent oxidoreductase
VSPCANVKVLVHAGSGGVGLAALQVAKATACHVVATAGNPEKRAAVRARGASCVAGSRDTRFVDVLACRGGQAGLTHHACDLNFLVVYHDSWLSTVAVLQS